MRRVIAVTVVVTLLVGCMTLPEKAFVVTDQQIARRQVETRKYEGVKEEALLVASSNVLQDMGFSLENSETKLGVLTASKQRDATSAGEIFAAILIAALVGASTPVSKDQTIRVSLVVRPVQATSDSLPKDSHFVRITFQRVVRRTDNSTLIETLMDDKLYQGFFEQLSKSVFLEAQSI